MKPRITALTLLLAALGVGFALLVRPADDSEAKPRFRVLVFSKTAGYRHDSIPAGIAAVRSLGGSNDFKVVATERAAAFAPKRLRGFDAVVFLNTTGDVLGPKRQTAFRSYVRHGGGFVGIHSAADTEYEWRFYGTLLGAYFKSHPAVQPATVRVVDRSHASTRHLPGLWTRTDEWYDFDVNPRPNVHVLAVLDESSYQGGSMGGDHPIAWCHRYRGGRSWYTGGGHTAAAYDEPAFRRHLLGGIRWAAGVVAGSCKPG